MSMSTGLVAAFTFFLLFLVGSSNAAAAALSPYLKVYPVNNNTSDDYSSTDLYTSVSSIPARASPLISSSSSSVQLSSSRIAIYSNSFEESTVSPPSSSENALLTSIIAARTSISSSTRESTLSTEVPTSTKIYSTSTSTSHSSTRPSLSTLSTSIFSSITPSATISTKSSTSSITSHTPLSQLESVSSDTQPNTSTAMIVTESTSTVTQVVNHRTSLDYYYSTVTAMIATSSNAGAPKNKKAGLSPKDRNIIIGCLVGILFPFLLIISITLYIFCRPRRTTIINSDGQIVNTYNDNLLRRAWYNVFENDDSDSSYLNSTGYKESSAGRDSFHMSENSTIIDLTYTSNNEKRGSHIEECIATPATRHSRNLQPFMMEEDMSFSDEHHDR